MDKTQSHEVHDIRLSVIIPAYNEEKRIIPTLDDTLAYSTTHFSDFEIIVVDDGSTDSTASIVQSYNEKRVRLLQVKSNQGKGNAVREGMLDARMPFVLFMDADGSTRISEITELFSVLQRTNADIVIGTRKIRAAHILKKQSFIRRFMGGFFTFLSQVVTHTSFSDYMCGFKLFKAETAKTLATLQTTKRFTFDTEYLCIARQRKLTVLEVPVTWEDKAGSKVRTVSATASSLYDLAKITYHSLRGTYRA